MSNHTDLLGQQSAGPIARTRLVFFGLVAFNLIAAALAIAVGRFGPIEMVVGSGLLLVLLAWLWTGGRRARFPAGSRYVEALLLGGHLAATASLELALAPFYTTVIYRSMYGSGRAARIRPAVYAVALAAGAWWAVDMPGAQLAGFVALHSVGLVFVSAIIHYLYRILIDHEASAELADENLAALRELEEMKNTFLTAVSHELRTPVTVVRGISELLAHRSDQLSTGKRQQLLDRLAANANRLSDLLEDLLDVDRLTRGSIGPERTEVDLSSLVHEVIEGLDADTHPIRLPEQPVIAHVDATMVERIVENLVHNAIKYSPPASPIDVGLVRDGTTVLLTVEDRGPGIPAEQREAVFEPFHQLERTHHSPGTGVGLALVRRFAELHGGRAWVEEPPAGGSRFCATLPEDPDVTR